MTLQHQQKQFSSYSSIAEVEKGLEFIINHFDPTILYFPRTIMTKKLGYQKEVYFKEEVLSYFEESNFMDCRINAFRYSTPDLIFIDLDRNNFETGIGLESALYNTLKNIKKQLDGIPTVLKSGGGYHIILPVYIPTALENIKEFQEFDNPSQEFLRFVKDSLSNDKADKNNNPSFKSCLLRIPGSINSKYNTQVTIVQKWNNYRPNISIELLLDFRRYLKNKNRQKTVLLWNPRRSNNNNTNNYHDYSYYYEWIDKKILTNPFPDCRKTIVDLILAPYLINIKKLSFEESYQIIREWLDKCNSMKKLDNYRNFVKYRISYALKNAASKPQIGPMSLYKIKTDDRYSNNLYLLILQKGKG